MITKNCPVIHYVSVHRAEAAQFSERNTTISLLLCKSFSSSVDIWPVSGVSVLQSWLFLFPDLFVVPGSLMWRPIRHSWYPLVGGDHGITDLLSELGNIFWALTKSLDFWQDLDGDFPWKSKTEGSEGNEICEWYGRAREAMAEGLVQIKRHDKN